MRVTNNMITSNTKSNMNANKVLVDKYNTQMTTQKKIERPSEDPVIAIRTLRMQTTMSHLDQYIDNNIADVDSWLELTNTALGNINTVLTDARSLCNQGATDTLNADDRQTILRQLQALGDQIYSEGNADNAGRTIFTGYRTTEQLTFKENEQDTTYIIDQKFGYDDMMEARYYYGETEIPADASTQWDGEMEKLTYNRIRFAYGKIDSLDSITVNGAAAPGTVTSYASLDAWREAAPAGTDPMVIGDNDMVFIESTGELILGKNIAHDIAGGRAQIEVTYTKTGFDKGEARPEYYYDCKKHTPDMGQDANGQDEYLEFTKQNQEIQFEISSGIMITANTQASDVLDTSIGRDITDMIDIVSTAINAHDKVKRIEQMKMRAEFADPTSQANLQTYLTAAEAEAVYADDNLKKTFQHYLTSFNNYLSKVDIAHTNVGSVQQRLELTKIRVENQRTTTEELKTKTENRDISDIIIDYNAAYNAYTASLMSASKVQQQTLLNYL